MRFEGRTAFVTGAASGIGAATVALLEAEGANVVGFDVAGDGDAILQGDVRDPDSVRDGIATAVERHGGLDVVCNIAGIVRFEPFVDMPLDEWRRHLDVNLTGTMLVCQAAMPHLLERTGCIVNMASVAGLAGQAYTSAYCASKAGVVMLTKSLALEFAAAGVRVNCVCPGGVDTPLMANVAPSIPADADPGLMARMMAVMPGVVQPDEVAEAVAYLASDAARSVTGSALVVDRGQLAG